MKKRKYRFQEGGDVVFPGDGRQDFDPDELAKASTRNLKSEIESMRDVETETIPSAAPTATRSKSFKEAFADARRAGDKTFEWQGKRYTTEMAAPKKAAAPAPAPTAPKVKQSIYDTSRDPLIRKVKEAFNAPVQAEREARRGQSGGPDPYYGKKGEDRMKAMRGYAKGGSVSSASKRADGCAIRGKTRGKMV